MAVIGFLALIALLSAAGCGVMLWAGYRLALDREPSEPVIFDLTKPEPPKLRLLQGGKE